MKTTACLFSLILLGSVTTPFAEEVQPAAPTTEAAKANVKLYDFSFVETDYAAVFRSISVTAGIDILLAPDVKGKISLKVTKKTWQETLDIICQMYDLTWLVEDKFISIQRAATYQAKQKKIAEQAEQEKQTAPLVRKNFAVHHAKADELVKVLETMRTSRGKISVVERSNSIIVYDTEATIEQIELALQELDVETLQIMISAKLVVVNSNLSRELGVDWTAKMGSTALTPGVAGTPTGGGTGSRISGAIQSFPNNGTSAAVTGASTAITTSILDNNMQIAISSLMGDASTEVLASPQVSTMDNKEAYVFMGDEISIRVIDDDGESSTQLVETGIKLTVTPHVSGDNRIHLELHPENNSYDYDTKGEVVISKQEAKTEVVVADGETVVIGGLTRNENQESESGIPFLKDIPILGNLFKYSRSQVIKKDLVIFVTPRIIRNYVGNVETSEPVAEIVSKGSEKSVAVNETAEPEQVKKAPEAKPVKKVIKKKKVKRPVEETEEDPAVDAEEAVAAPEIPEEEYEEVVE